LFAYHILLDNVNMLDDLEQSSPTAAPDMDTNVFGSMVARLMGHADITILRQYLPLLEGDLQEAHARFGAVDNLIG
jgi:hypothetical protein